MKKRIYFHLPPFWPDGDQPEPLEWLAVDGEKRDEGCSLPADAPQAEHVVAVLPACVAMLAAARIPGARGRKRDGLLKYAMEELTLSGVEDIHAAAGKADASGNAPVIVISGEWMKKSLGKLKVSGVTPSAAYLDVLMRAREGDLPWLVAANGEWFLRTGEAGGFILDSPVNAEPPALLAGFVKSRKPGAIIAFPGENGGGDTLAKWSEKLDVPITVRDAGGWRQYANGCGNGGINILCGRFAPRRDYGRAARTAANSLALISLISVLWLGGSLLEIVLLKKALANRKGEMIKIAREAAPGEKNLEDPAAAVNRLLAELGVQSGESAPANPAPLIAGALSGFGGEAKIRNLEYDGSAVSVAVAADNMEIAGGISSKLRKAGFDVVEGEKILEGDAVIAKFSIKEKTR